MVTGRIAAFNNVGVLYSLMHPGPTDCFLVQEHRTRPPIRPRRLSRLWLQDGWEMAELACDWTEAAYMRLFSGDRSNWEHHR